MPYDDRFFDWVDSGARISAQKILPRVKDAVELASVVDIGCGRGTWLAVWREHGINKILGVDGSYVDRSKLAIPAEAFRPADLSGQWNIHERFDLAQSLEVFEHLPESAARSGIEQLCRLADVILFSAARPGQGGEMHINEQEPEYWAELFDANGFAMFDCIRPYVATDRQIEPWYRYNGFIFANEAGQKRLSPAATATRVPKGSRTAPIHDIAWNVRRAVLRHLSVTNVTRLSRARYRVATALRTLTRKRA